MSKLNIAELNKIVLESLGFFSNSPVPKLNTKNFSFGFIVGSGNAYNTGQIIFNDQKALYANESNFNNLLKTYHSLIKEKVLKEAVIISASGEKDAIWEIKAAKKAGLKTTLLTCEPDSSGAKIAENVLPFRKIAEPYTYNFSTYFGMIISKSGERARDIKKEIDKIDATVKKINFKKYKSFAFVLPDRYEAIAGMINIKHEELFGPLMSLRAFSEGQARHAKFVHPSKDELVISFSENKYFGEKNSRLEINLNKNAGPGLILAASYYLIGLIQGSKPPYFKKDIEAYCTKTGAIAYKGKNKFNIIVPGN